MKNYYIKLNNNDLPNLHRSYGNNFDYVSTQSICNLIQDILDKGTFSDLTDIAIKEASDRCVFIKYIDPERFDKCLEQSRDKITLTDDGEQAKLYYSIKDNLIYAVGTYEIGNYETLPLKDFKILIDCWLNENNLRQKDGDNYIPPQDRPDYEEYKLDIKIYKAYMSQYYISLAYETDNLKDCLKYILDFKPIQDICNTIEELKDTKVTKETDTHNANEVDDENTKEVDNMEILSTKATNRIVNTNNNIAANNTNTISTLTDLFNTQTIIKNKITSEALAKLDKEVQKYKIKYNKAQYFPVCEGYFLTYPDSIYIGGYEYDIELYYTITTDRVMVKSLDRYSGNFNSFETISFKDFQTLVNIWMNEDRLYHLDKDNYKAPMHTPGYKYHDLDIVSFNVVDEKRLKYDIDKDVLNQ